MTQKLNKSFSLLVVGLGLIALPVVAQEKLNPTVEAIIKKPIPILNYKDWDMN